jgi:hypothetical protein
LRFATLTSTPRAAASVSDVVRTCVNYVLIHFTAPPYRNSVGQTCRSAEISRRRAQRGLRSGASEASRRLEMLASFFHLLAW